MEIPEVGSLTGCGCCRTIYRYEVGKHTELCEDCYVAGCHTETSGCESGRIDKRLRRVSRRENKDWKEEWDKATRPYLNNEQG